MDIEKAAAEIGADIFNAGETIEQPAQVDAPEATPEPVEEDIPVPASWKKEMHEYWPKIPAEVRKYQRQREEEMLKGLEQYKEHHEIGRRFKEAATPYQQYFQQMGVDEIKAFQALASADHRLRNSPVEQRRQMFEHLARDYGIDFAQAAAQQAQPDPQTQAMLSKVNQLEQMLMASKQKEFDDFARKTEQEVTEFSKDKPYFDELGNDIAQLISVGNTLEQAYEKAVWANPVTRAKEIARANKEAQDKLKGQSKQSAQAARNASSANVQNRDTNRPPTEVLGTMEDTMKATLEKIRSRAH